MGYRGSAFYLKWFSPKSLCVTNHPEWQDSPAPWVENNLVYIINNCLDVLRERVGVLKETSGYRSELLNRRLGGAPSSLHRQGLAADLVCMERKDIDVAMAAISLNLPIKELILYPLEKANRIHIGFYAEGQAPVLKKFPLVVCVAPKVYVPFHEYIKTNKHSAWPT